MDVIGFNEAKKEGLKFYFNGKHCPRGHLSERYTSSRACVICSKENDFKSRSKRKEYWQKWQAENKDKTRAACQKYNEKHREKRREYDRERRKDPKVKAKRAAYERARRQNIRAGGGSVKKHHLDSLLAKQSGKCANCKAKLKKYHVDHIKPIKKGGTSDLDNLQILCPNCNMRKGIKDPIDFARQEGRLL